MKFIDDQRSAKPRFKGFTHGLSIIVREQGLSGTYKGQDLYDRRYFSLQSKIDLKQLLAQAMIKIFNFIRILQP